ncbi:MULTISPECIES: hypothetical protein [unclassified Marinovum]|uniref:hypothetical protein n=1 Tax=unclassified Marinovum TaxID=2647166 RepID=UPI003EDC861B
MKKSIHPVSDHAVLRYLERVHGVDVEAIRRELGRKMDVATRHGARQFTSNGIRFVLGDNGVLVTCFDVVSAHVRRRKPKREGE